MKRFIKVAAVVVVLLNSVGAPFTSPALAALFVPQHDDDVLERLPSRVLPSTERLQERLIREALKRDPRQLPLALQAARQAIGRARRLGDPRELGQAQAALAPWWALDSPPPEVRLLRAIVLQSQHHFDAALLDLDALLKPGERTPLAVQAQAELTRASVLQVQAHWREAAQGCERLIGPHYAALNTALELPARVCLAELMSLQGRAAEASATLAALARQISRSADVDRGSLAWLALVRAELEERRGTQQAAALFKQALQEPAQGQHQALGAAQADVYTLAAYADFLLAHKREPEVVALLAGREDLDPLLLRLAIAWQRSGDARAAPAIQMLAARFEAAALRGDRSHGREQARFELELQGHASAALAYALTNWEVQKEPADALVLLHAAQAAKQPQAAEPVWRWVRATGLEDVRMKAFMPPARLTAADAPADTAADTTAVWAALWAAWWAA